MTKYAKISLVDRTIVELSDEPIELPAGDGDHTTAEVSDDAQIGEVVAPAAPEQSA